MEIQYYEKHFSGSMKEVEKEFKLWRKEAPQNEVEDFNYDKSTTGNIYLIVKYSVIR